MLKFVVKGSKKTALKHAKMNGVNNPVFVTMVNSNKETILKCEETEENNSIVSKWFVNPEYGFEAPFKVGSVLHYFWE